MKFEDALQAMREGKTVKRPYYDVSFTLKDNEILYRYKDFGGYFFGLKTIDVKDILSDDWEIVYDKL